MVSQPKWDIYESALIIETYLFCKDLPHKDQVPYLETLSKNLRLIAKNKGLKIDDTYRNLNGMNMQFQSIKYLFTGKGAFNNPSKMFVKAYKLYMKDRASFYLILSDAHLMIENKFDFAQLNSYSSDYNLFTQTEDFDLPDNEITELIISQPHHLK
ncbi:MAG: hypothetical protein IJS60_00720 [Abditibacteriota bacterium]|nr:hypothetical protein [Abditibacteriota bacterium]